MAASAAVRYSAVMRLGTSLHRITTWISLAGYIVVVSGLPLPLGGSWSGGSGTEGLAAKDRSRPFPCMDKPCGCVTAEQCFANCCCHTAAERLAWACAHDVEDAVLTALERRVAAAESAPAGGCRGRESTACCSTGPSSGIEGPEICGDYQSLAADPVADAEPPAPAEDRPAPVRVVVLRAMLACGGIASAWSAATVSVAPPPRSSGEFQPSDCVGWIALFDESAPGEHSAPDAPPPRA